MLARMGLAGGRIGGAMGIMVSTGKGIDGGADAVEDFVCFLVMTSAAPGSLWGSEASESTAAESPLLRSVGDDDSGVAGGDLKNSLRGENPVVGDTGFFLNRTVLAPVQAFRLASKQAKPTFQVASSMTARRRFSFFDRILARTVSPTVSGLSNRQDAGVSSSSLESDSSEVHSRRGRKCASSSEKML